MALTSSRGTASPWLLACTGLLAALLGFGKRAHELGLRGGLGEDPSRASRLPAPHPDHDLFVLAMTTSAAYALYTQDPHTVALFDTRALIWTLPFGILGIGRFLALALSERQLYSPTEAMLRDPVFLANIALWGATVIAIVYKLG